MSEPMPEGELRIVLFTDLAPVVGLYAQTLDALGHRLVGVVTARKRSPEYIQVVSGAPPTADVFVSDRPRRWARMLAPLRPDLIIVTVFPWRLPQDLLELPPLGAINMHPSLLPAYRGTMTPNWMLINGERTGGMTFHRMVADFDAGPILAQVAFEIDKDDDLNAYTQRMVEHWPKALGIALQRVIAGDGGDTQDESQATYFGPLPDAVRSIDWSSPARRIHNQVRGLSAFVHPTGASTTIDGMPVQVLRTRVVTEPVSSDVTPGTILSRDRDGLTIQCGDGAIKLLHYEPA